ncbi:MAG: hypothetical protein GVY36_02630 [Verrucomicrobia bacterium]|jgi:cobaltochelatase CobT|nr:hypothetical protein [Verrucomicrobiota bacterium]
MEYNLKVETDFNRDLESRDLLYRLARFFFSDDTIRLADSDLQQVSKALRLPDYGLDTLARASRALDDGIAFANLIRPLTLDLRNRHGSCDPTPTAQDMEQCYFTISDSTSNELDESASDGNTAHSASVERHFNYRIYSSRHDEVDFAGRWLPADLRYSQDRFSKETHQKARRLAHQFQRVLRSAQLRRWHFECEQGLLDPRRLSRLLFDNTDFRVFRRESNTPLPEAQVCFLLDLSGSMDEARREMAVLAIDMAVHSLEICGIRTEVLGFTTTHWASNPVADQWESDGRPQEPGRINAVRHVVFKTAGQRWFRARRVMGLCFVEGFGKENLDGEALHWAATRLQLANTHHRALVVLSDGAPHDAATVEANGRGLLEDHLRSVITQIEESGIALAAIGTRQDVSRFYRNSAIVRSADKVPQVLLEKLLYLIVDSTSEPPK